MTNFSLLYICILAKTVKKIAFCDISKTITDKQLTYPSKKHSIDDEINVSGDMIGFHTLLNFTFWWKMTFYHILQIDGKYSTLFSCQQSTCCAISHMASCD